MFSDSCILLPIAIVIFSIAGAKLKKIAGFSKKPRIEKIWKMATKTKLSTGFTHLHFLHGERSKKRQHVNIHLTHDDEHISVYYSCYSLLLFFCIVVIYWSFCNLQIAVQHFFWKVLYIWNYYNYYNVAVCKTAWKGNVGLYRISHE